MSDSSGTRSLTYADGLPEATTYTAGPLSGLEVKRGYDLTLGRRISEVSARFTSTTAPFHAVSYGYADTLGRLKTVTIGTKTLTYGYRSDTDDVSSVTYAAETSDLMVQEWQRDRLRRVTSVGARGLAAGSPASYAESARAFDDLNRAARDTLAGGESWSYGYDALGQVTDGSRRRADDTARAGWQFGYAHDAIGNRTAATVNGRESAYSPNALNQYDSRTVPGYIDVRGTAPLGLTLLIDDAILARPQEAGARADFHQALAVDNSTQPVARSLKVQAVNLAVEPPEVTTERRQIFVPQTPEIFTHDADGNLST